MALQVEAPRPYIERSIHASIASLKRSLTKQHNPIMVDIINKDIAIYQNALNTIKDK